jgi:hypothetical protein
MTWLDSGFIAIGPRFARIHWRSPGMTSEDNEKAPEKFSGFFVSAY